MRDGGVVGFQGIPLSCSVRFAFGGLRFSDGPLSANVQKFLLFICW